MNLNLAALRAANTARLPRFLNNLGGVAHSTDDGSDWSPIMWMIAMMGEVGETAEALDEGNDHDDHVRKLASEIADVQIYLDIFARRATDQPDYTKIGNASSLGECMEGSLFEAIMKLGRMCELHKKYVRGDIQLDDYRERRKLHTDALIYTLVSMTDKRADRTWAAKAGSGIDLAAATIDKFNRTSEKVKADVKLGENHVVVDGVASEASDELAVPMVSRGLFQRVTDGKAPIGVVLDVRWDGDTALSDHSQQLKMSNKGWWIDSKYRLYASPDEWRLPQGK